MKPPKRTLKRYAKKTGNSEDYGKSMYIGKNANKKFKAEGMSKKERREAKKHTTKVGRHKFYTE